MLNQSRFSPCFIQECDIQAQAVHIDDRGTGLVKRHDKDRVIQRHWFRTGVAGAAVTTETSPICATRPRGL